MSDELKTENEVKIEKVGELLILNKEGVLSIIRENNDTKSEQIDSMLKNMINCYYGRFSSKQLFWILEKVRYIIRHNLKYRHLIGVRDLQLI
jgi:hypothetical protein